MLMRLKSIWSFVLLGLGCCLSAIAADTAPTTAPETLAPKSYQIRNQQYGQLLRPRDANSATGTLIVLYPAQLWKCMTWKFYAAGESRYQLQNHFTSKTFEVNLADSAAAVTQAPFGKQPSDRPTWQFTKLSDGKYRITEIKSGKALTAIKSENSSGCRIVVQPWHESDDQKWELIEIDPKDLTM